MEGYSKNISVKRNFETSLSNSGFMDEDQLGDITCPQSHLGHFFLQGIFIVLREHYGSAFLCLFREVKTSVFLYIAKILFLFLILWLVSLVFFNGLYIHTSNTLENIVKVTKKTWNFSELFFDHVCPGILSDPLPASLRENNCLSLRFLKFLFCFNSVNKLLLILLKI